MSLLLPVEADPKLLLLLQVKKLHGKLVTSCSVEIASTHSHQFLSSLIRSSSPVTR